MIRLRRDKLREKRFSRVDRSQGLAALQLPFVLKAATTRNRAHGGSAAPFRNRSGQSAQLSAVISARVTPHAAFCCLHRNR